MKDSMPRPFPFSGRNAAGRRSWPFCGSVTTRSASDPKSINPDIVVVLDPTLLDIVDVSSGLKPRGTLIINSAKTIDQVQKDYGFKGRVAVVDAGKIAMEEMKVPITNTTMLGALIRAAGIDRVVLHGQSAGRPALERSPNETKRPCSGPLKKLSSRSNQRG